MNVTKQVLEYAQTYGGSYSPNSSSISTSKSLNFAQGPSLMRPIIERVTATPTVINYSDTVGLFGAENAFVRFDLDIQDMVQAVEGEEYASVDNYFNASVIRGVDEDEFYEVVRESITSDDSAEGYTAGLYNTKIADAESLRLSIELINVGVGNKYIDSWVDVCLYNSNRLTHEDGLMYVKVKDTFYVGIHARNSRRLPYNIQLRIGDRLVVRNKMTVEEERLLN